VGAAVKAWRKGFAGTSASDWVRPVEDDWSPFPRAKHRKPESVRAHSPAAPVAPPPPQQPKPIKPDFEVKTWDAVQWDPDGRYFKFKRDTGDVPRW